MFQTWTSPYSKYAKTMSIWSFKCILIAMLSLLTLIYVNILSLKNMQIFVCLIVWWIEKNIYFPFLLSISLDLSNPSEPINFRATEWPSTNCFDWGHTEQHLKLNSCRHLKSYSAMLWFMSCRLYNIFLCANAANDSFNARMIIPFPI